MTHFSRRIAAASLAVLAAVSTAGAGTGSASLEPRGDRDAGTPDAPQLTDRLAAFDRIELDAEEAAGTVASGAPLRIAAGVRTFDVRLERASIRSGDCVVQVTRAGGVVERLDPGPVTTYRGSVDGLPGADARFTIDGSGVEGVILTDDGWWYVEPERDLAKAGGRGSHVVYAGSDVLPGAYGRCGTTLADELNTAVERHAPVEKAQGGLPPLPPIVELATEADYDFFKTFANARAANNEIASIVNEVDGVYQRQLGVAFTIVFQNVWETRDDPYTATDAGMRLGEFRSYWNSRQQFVRRDLAHLWTAAPIDGNTLGVAYLGVACASPSASYGLSSRYGAAPGKFVLTAHEIGHNFSAVHPDQQQPPVTSCDTTIMQSFVNNGFTFCRYSRTQIENWLVSNSACLRNNHEPAAAAGPDRFAGQGDTVALIGGGSTDSDGDTLALRWAQTGGPAVSLSGATTATATFAAPAVGADTVLTFTLTAEDGRGGVGRDTVEVTVVAGDLPAIVVSAPAGGASFKVGKSLKIRWTVEAPITGGVRIELSRDGGATFETIVDGASATAGRWKWKVTGPRTRAALLRITSTSLPRSQGFTTSVFTIG